jgi:hypothetical protein
LENVKFPNSLVYIGDYAFWMGLDVKSLVLPDSVVYIGCNAFSENMFSRNTICSIKLPQGLKELTADSALCGLELKKLELPSSLVSITMSAFLDNDIKKLIIPENVVYIYCGMDIDDFTVDSNMYQKIVINSTKVKYIEKGAFNGLRKNCIIEVPAVKYDQYKEMLLKSGLSKKIQIKAINVNIGNDGNGNRWTYDKKTATLTFEGKAAIENNYYEKTEELYKSDWHAWSGTAKKLVIKSGIKGIGKDAFKNFTNLRSIEMADTVKTVENNAFEGCSILKTKIEIKGRKQSVYNAYKKESKVKSSKSAEEEDVYGNYYTYDEKTKTLTLSRNKGKEIRGNEYSYSCL